MNMSNYRWLSIVFFVVVLALGFFKNRIGGISGLLSGSAISHLVNEYQWSSPFCFEDINQDQVEDIIALRRARGIASGELTLVMLDGKSGEALKTSDESYPSSSKLQCLGHQRVAVERKDLVLDIYDLEQFKIQHSLSLENQIREIRASDSCLSIQYPDEIHSSIDLSTFQPSSCEVPVYHNPVDEELICKMVSLPDCDEIESKCKLKTKHQNGCFFTRLECNKDRSWLQGDNNDCKSLRNEYYKGDLPYVIKERVRYEFSETSGGVHFLLFEAFNREKKLWSNKLRMTVSNKEIKPIFFGEEIIFYGRTIEDDPKGVLFHLDKRSGEIIHQWTIDTYDSEFIGVFEVAEPYIIINFGSHIQSLLAYDPVKRETVWDINL